LTHLTYAIFSATSSHDLSDAGLAEGRPTAPTTVQQSTINKAINGE